MKSCIDMGEKVDKSRRLGLADGSVGRTTSPASKGKAPRTARGEKTLRKILDAALLEFGQRGFHDSSIVGITSRAKVALGTFYTYFDSKEAVFAALVRDMSRQVRDYVAPDIALDTTYGQEFERIGIDFDFNIPEGKPGTLVPVVMPPGAWPE